MCGITGIFNVESSAPTGPDELEAMVETIHHRGPDAKGVYTFPGGGLGSTRLAIIDLRPESNMPFSTSDGRFTIAYNGEVYNYLELRDELEALGHQFRTTSDTEVVVEAYRRWGSNAVGRFNGMWALAIYDAERDELFCSRDRFGIKPFFYAQHDGRLLLGSEIKTLLAIAPELARPDRAQFARFVVNAPIHETATFFAEVKQLPAAHNMLVTRSNMETSRYWDYPLNPVEVDSPEEAADEVRALLDDAIRLRLRSDVPVGMLLSAGVDSTTIAYLIRQFEHGPFRAFTASYPDDPFDEAPGAAATAQRLQIEHQLISEDGVDILETTKQGIWHLEAPTGYSEIVPRWHIYRQMRGEITVAFEGQGADELFGGYTTENAPHALLDALARADLLDAGATIRRQLDEVGWRTASRRAAANTLSPAILERVRRARGHDFSARGVAGRKTERPDRRDLQDHLTTLLHRQHSGELRDRLRWGDAISMAHSIETRYPFLDHRLVEYGFRLPGHFKMHRGVGKAVLRDAARPDVPESILQPKRKLGFGTPMERWFRHNPEQNLYPLLHDQTARDRNLFNMTRVDQAAEALLAGRSDTSWLLFKWLTSELWFRQFIDPAMVVGRPLSAASYRAIRSA